MTDFMKKLAYIVFLAVVLCSCGTSRKAQTTATQLTPQQIAAADAAEASKKYEAEGWKCYPSDLPMKRQLEQNYLKLQEVDESGFPLYITGSGRAVGETHSAARMAAQMVAINDLAAKIETNLLAIVEESAGNQQIDPESAASISSVVRGSQNVISQRLGRTISLVTFYRELPTKNIEVEMTLAYNAKFAEESAKAVVREELTKKSAELLDKINQVRGF